MNVVPRELDLQFQCQTFSCSEFVIKNAPTADAPSRFASTRMAAAVELPLLYILALLTSVGSLLNNEYALVS